VRGKENFWDENFDMKNGILGREKIHLRLDRWEFFNCKVYEGARQSKGYETSHDIKCFFLNKRTIEDKFPPWYQT
jgi:hypothetical protein